MASSSTSAGTSSLFVSSSASPIPSSVAPSSAPSSIPTPSETSTPSLTSSSATPTSPSSNPPPGSSSSEPPSSTPPPPPPPSSSPTPSPTPTPTPTPSSNPPPPSSTSIPTSVITAPSAPPVTTVITQTVAPTSPGQSPSFIVITIVSTRPPSNPSGVNSSPSGPPTPTGTTDPKLQEIKNAKSTSGLGPSGKTAIAVVVPVVVVALLVLAGIILWRKRKQRKSAEEARRKEVEEYGYNPNHDPTLPAVGMQSEMAEDQGGYRGWGNTTSSNRQASTTLNSGMAYSDSNSNPGGYTSPGSPTAAGSDGHSLDPLMNGRRETLDSEGIGALGAAPVAGQNQTGVHRGPSNASSSYSAAGHSDSSDNYPLPMTNPQEYYDNNNYYGQNPYDSNGYGGGGQPVIRDVSARRNTRIENPSIFPQQGNSGIAQNF